MAPMNLDSLKAAIAEILDENNKKLEAMIKDAVKADAAKTKRKEARAKRDPDMPKRPKNAYQLWCDDNREEVKKELEDVKELSKELGRRWNEVSDEDKAPYQEQYQKRKQEYDAKMKEYKNKKAEETENSSEDTEN